MRAFFGLSPDPKTKLAVEAWRNKAFPHFQAAVPAANFHITLAFLGKISAKQLDGICTEVDQISDIPTFDVLLNQVGYWSKPKALWLGCHETENEHLQLSKTLTHIANTNGLHLSKQAYIAHLTLARKCSVNPPAPLIPPSFAWRNTAFHLYESVSGKNGVSYHVRRSWPLSNKIRFSF